MRVLHVSASMAPRSGGTTHAVRSIVAASGAHGIAHTIACTDDDGAGGHLPADDPLRRAPGIHMAPRGHRLYSWSPDLAAWLARHASKHDVVHVHGLFNHPALAGMRAARRANVPLVVSPHGMAGRYGMRHKRWRKLAWWRLLERPLVNRAAMVLVTGRLERMETAAAGVRAPMCIARLPVALPLPGDADRVRRDGTDLSDRKVILSMARIDPVKNIDGLMRALTQPVAGMADAVLLIAGMGEDGYVGTLRQLADDLGIASRVRWLGFLDGERKHDVLAAADVAALPSHSENFGVAAVEMAGAGLPVVVGRHVGVADDLAHAGIAVVTETGPVAIAEALARALALAPRFNRDAARVHVAKTYSADAIGAEMARLYRETAATRGAA